MDGWLNPARKVLFEGVAHRQAVLTAPKRIRPLILAEAEFLKVFMDAGAAAVKELIEQWRKKRKIRIGIKAAGLVYELTRDGVSRAPVVEPKPAGMSLPVAEQQLAFAF